ncbi:SurA N-terminal domain-containing protein [Helicobacter cetorum]|uniref:Uncharacterized protein n=1 Tax=Helicobacter cetorum (strain ATCC BAA-540 / CCUG 52418 / MIT 99-5656) TaxID=1163745 RepID=I0ESZ1_HELCM|nr:hypothetical protein [Helicobacter cetorum]AFI06060.1 hypothetical protein HCD_05290 [Helicobacter cetorum MIT 99-5656]
MRKIFSYVSCFLLFLEMVYGVPKVEALQGKKPESSLDKKIRQEMKAKETKTKGVKPKIKAKAEVHHVEVKNNTQKMTSSKAKGAQKPTQSTQNLVKKPSGKDKVTKESENESPSSQFNSIFGHSNNAMSNTPEDKVVGGISLLVNGSPITLYQIQEEQEKSKVSKAQARDHLIAERIKNQEIERLKIHVDDDRLDQEMDMIARQQGMDLDHFKQMIMSEGQYKAYREQLKEHLEMQELLRNILLTNVDTSSETKMREYYNQHREQFSIPTQVETVRYTSSNQQDLERAMTDPNLEVPGVSKANEKIEMKTLNPQIAQVFISHAQGSFTPIMNGGGGQFITFYIKEKIGKNEVSFSQAKQFIAQKLVEESKDKILEEHFEKLRIKAKIVMIRE